MSPADVDKPRPDVYLVLLILTFAATTIAAALMFYESTLLKG